MNLDSSLYRVEGYLYCQLYISFHFCRFFIIKFYLFCCCKSVIVLLLFLFFVIRILITKDDKNGVSLQNDF